ncbi:SDR family oxidoreductase [Alphaproteobacteria bacterium]|nr:SDR family oxidoreductase [Alphaproteobacteria bacterium]
MPRYFLNLEIINNSFSNDYLSSKKNILVIGGLGYIGSHLVDSLLKENKSVTVLDCQMYGNDVLNKFTNNSNFKFIKAYASDVIALSKAIKDSEIVVHLAGLVGDPACSLDENETKYLNIKTTSIIQNLCSEYSVKKLIFASSCSVYGKSEDEISDEKSKLNPVSLYAQTKKDSEEELLNGKFTNISIVRFATVFGHSLRERYDLVCNLFCAQAYFNKEITVEGGSQRRPFIHVRDAARSLKVLIETDKDIRKSIYNIGFDDQNYSISDIASQIKINIKDTNIKYLKSLNDERDYFVNFNKFNVTFNFSKTLDLKSGIQEMVDNFKTKDDGWNFLGENYSNKKTTESFLNDFKGDKLGINNFN